MKVAKKLLAGIMTAALCVTAPVGVWAAEVHNSMTVSVKPSGDSVGKYVVTEKIEETQSFQDLKEKAPVVAELVEIVNKIVNALLNEEEELEQGIPEESLSADAGKKASIKFVDEMKKLLEETDEEGNLVLTEEAKESVEKIVKEMEEKELDFVTPFFDLDLEKDAEVEKNENGNYDVTLSVPLLTDSLKDVNLLHYSTVRDLWEIIEPDEVDVQEQTLKAEFIDFSPIAIVAKVDTQETEESEDAEELKEASEEETPELTVTPAAEE